MSKASSVTSTSPILEFTVENLHTIMKEKFNDVDEKVATKPCIEKVLHVIDEQKQTILKNQVIMPSSTNVGFA